jgi:tetratricopeptide (TPR) repeat protein
LQNELATNVAEQVAGKLTPKERSRLPEKAQPVNPAAYEADLKGEYFLTKWSTEGFEKAKQYFEQSINIDPMYAQGYAGLGEYYSIVALLGVVPSPRNYLKAEDLSRKAMEIDKTLVQPYVTLGMVKLLFRCDPSGAENDLNRALELEPGSLYALDYHSYYLLKIGRIDDAITEKRESSSVIRSR